MKTVLLLFFLSFITTTNFSKVAHDYYFSATSIEHNKANKSLEITSSYFTDDLEKAVEKTYKVRLFLGEKKEHKDADKYIAKYFKENFNLTIDGKKVEYEYLGKEVEIEKTYNYVEVLNVPSFKKINIENRMLFNVSRTQENMIKVKQNNTRKSVVLFYKRPKGEISF